MNFDVNKTASGSLVSPLQSALWSAERDPVGDRLHLGAAILFMFFVPLATAPRDAASGILLGITLLRLFKIASAYRSVVVVTVFWAIVAYFTWMLIGLTWVSDIDLGLVDIKKHRMLLVPLLLLPVLHHAPILIYSFLMGVLLVNLVQILEFLQWPGGWFEPTTRYGAFNNPIVTSVFTVVALCYWLQALLVLPARRLWIGIPVILIAVNGLALSGSRGPLLGLGVAVFAMLSYVLAVNRGLRKRLLLLLGLVALLSSAMFMVAPATVATTLDAFPKAFNEFQESKSNSRSSVGIRMAMMEYGFGVIKDHPWIGTGPGCASRYMPDGMDLHGSRGDRVHLHNTYLLAAVTLGMPGLMLLLWILLSCFKMALPLLCTMSVVGGTVFGLIAWMVSAVFDSYQASGNYLGLFGILLSFSLIGFGRKRDLRAANEVSKAND